MGGFLFGFPVLEVWLVLYMVDLLVVMLGYPVCGVWFWLFCIGLMPIFLCFLGRCCPFVVFSGGLLTSCIAPDYLFGLWPFWK